MAAVWALVAPVFASPGRPTTLALAPQSLLAVPPVGFADACPPASDTGGITIVWTHSARTTEADWFEALSAAVNEGPVYVRLYCGTSTCMVAAEKLAQRAKPGSLEACLTAKRLQVQELAAGTPAESWARHHMLAKVMGGPKYETHLQVAMQLAALWKHGGIVYEPGVTAPGAQAGDWIGTSTGTIQVAGTLVGRVLLKGGKITDDALESRRGLLAVSSSQPHADFVKDMLTALVGEYPTFDGYDESYNYDRTKWPFHLSFEPMLDVARRKGLRVVRIDEAARLHMYDETRYAPYSFYIRQAYLKSTGNNAMNIGDEMQQLAGLQFMPHVSAFVERDDLSESWGEGGTVQHGGTGTNNTIIFANAWYDKSARTWPPPADLNPVYLSMHFEDDALPQKSLSLKSLGHWPVGTRDTASDQLLTKHAIHSSMLGDLTNTLAPICDRSKGGPRKVRIIDVAESALKAIVPKDVIDGAVFDTHKVFLPSQKVTNQLARYADAYGHLRDYSCDTRLIITERIHAALPSVAMGTPVLLIDDAATLPGGAGGLGELRLADAKQFMHVATVEGGAPAGFDWHNPPQNPEGDTRLVLLRNLREVAACHDPTLADAGVKFGALPEEFADIATARDACESSPTTKDVIHVAAGLDITLLVTGRGQGVPFASWLKALGAANAGSTLWLHLLVDQLTEAQKCLVRAKVRRHLSPSSRVTTVSVDGRLDELAGNYNGLPHITRVTMARLLLPSILPCVDKVLWIDIDALVLKPLTKLFAIEPTTECGIAGRQSMDSRYTIQYYKGPDREQISHQWTSQNSVGFNAGVMVMSLKKMRAQSKRYDAVVKRVAWEYGNDDQVVLNYWCSLEPGNGTFTQLDHAWNVFHAANPADPQLHAASSEWFILHYDSEKKPWCASSGLCSTPWFANSNTKGIWDAYETNLWSE